MRRALALALAAALVACAAPSADDVVVLDRGLRPSFEGFASARGAGVYLARRCGSLDCHGRPGRGVILYSTSGMRAPARPGQPQPVTGGAPLSADEIRANYTSVVSLEPEVMATVVSEGGRSPERLMLLRKPLGTERHKGGTVFTDETDPGWLCLTTWLTGKVDEDQCEQGARLP